MKKENDDYYSYVTNHFKRWSSIYDLFVSLFFISKIREKVVEVTSPKKGSKILDICSGTGGQALAFGKRGYQVIGIDLSEHMLKVAEKKNKYKNVKFEVGDAADMPFKDNSYDISCISFGLHEMPKDIIKKVLFEINRVTKTNGKIVIIDYTLPKNSILKFLGYHFIKFYESKYYSPFVKVNLKKLIGEYGIKIVNRIPLTFGFCEIIVCVK